SSCHSCRASAPLAALGNRERLPCNLALQRPDGIARESKPGQRLAKILPESERLEISAEHFRMQQSLQGTFFRSIKVGLRKRSGNDSGEKMMLIGKTDRSGTRYLRRFGKTGPLNVH